MNGGRKKWLLEDRPVSKEIPQYAKGNFKASDADNSIRVFLNYVKESLEKVRKNTVANPFAKTNKLKYLAYTIEAFLNTN